MKVWFCLLAGLLIISAWGSETFTEDDLDRILVTRSSPMKFWVFRGYTEDNAFRCVPLIGVRKTVRILPDAVEKTDFFAGSGEFDLLHAVICVFPYRNRYMRRWAVTAELARQMGVMPEAVALQLQQLRKLSRLLSSLQQADQIRDEAERRDRMDEIMAALADQSNYLFAALEEQCQQKQFLLAVSMHMAVCEVQNRSRIRSREMRTRIFSMLNRRAEKTLIACAGNLYRNQPYKEEYVKLFPRTRGLWHAAPPTAWNELQHAWQQSLQSYYELRNYSAAADFEAWGCCMLNVLLFAGEMPQAEPLIRQYRDAITQYRKIFVP